MAPIEQARAALAANDLTGAIGIASSAVEAGADDVLLLNLAAYGLQLRRQFTESMALLTRAVLRAPRDPLIHNAIGHLLSQQAKTREAAEAFQRAITLEPRLAPAHNGLAKLHEGAGDYERARVHFENAAALAPDFADPLAGLAALAVQRKDYTAARDLAERALVLDSSQPEARLCLARLDTQGGRLEAAEARLRALLTEDSLAPLHEAAARKMVADVLHARGDSSSALQAYIAGNRLVREIHQPRFAGAESGVDMTRRLARYFRAAPAEIWASPPPKDEAARHVFLIGFFRSGTTLLEQVLASHPDIRTLEEKPMLEEAANAFFQSDEGLDQLAVLPPERVEDLRASYWRKVRSHGVEPQGVVFVDKSPLGAMWTPLIVKLFPDARLLFSRRDPRDVVLSCFRHRFEATPFMYEFTDLGRAAELYAGVMELFEIYRERLAPAVRICRHETLIERFDEETRGICAFLNIPWDEAMRNFVETARNRDIQTPSASQVVRGLNARGVGQWRAYATGMVEALEILRPWVEKYGYPP